MGVSGFSRLDYSACAALSLLLSSGFSPVQAERTNRNGIKYLIMGGLLGYKGGLPNPVISNSHTTEIDYKSRRCTLISDCPDRPAAESGDLKSL